MFSRYGVIYSAYQNEKGVAARKDASAGIPVVTPSAAEEIAVFLRLGGVAAVFSAALACLLWVTN